MDHNSKISYQKLRYKFELGQQKTNCAPVRFKRISLISRHLPISKTFVFPFLWNTLRWNTHI